MALVDTTTTLDCSFPGLIGLRHGPRAPSPGQLNLVQAHEHQGQARPCFTHHHSPHGASFPTFFSFCPLPAGWRLSSHFASLVTATPHTHFVEAFVSFDSP